MKKSLLLLFCLSAFLLCAREYTPEEQKSFSLYFSDVEENLRRGSMEPEYLEKLTPVFKARFLAEFYDRLSPEQQSEWVTLQQSEVCRKFNDSVRAGKPNSAALFAYVRENCPHLASATDGKQFQELIQSSVRAVLSREAASTPLSKVRSLGELKFADEREKNVFARFAADFEKGFLQNNPDRELAALCTYSFIDDFKRELYDRMPEDLRRQWIEFQLSPDCAEMNRRLLAREITREEMEKEYREKAPALSAYESAHRMTLQKLAVRAQMLARPLLQKRKLDEERKMRKKSTVKVPAHE